jgi:hypothetical protein
MSSAIVVVFDSLNNQLYHKEADVNGKCILSDIPKGSYATVWAILYQPFIINSTDLAELPLIVHLKGSKTFISINDYKLKIIKKNKLKLIDSLGQKIYLTKIN